MQYLLATLVVLGVIYTVDSWNKNGANLETSRDWIIFAGVSGLIVVGMAALGFLIEPIVNLLNT